MRLGRYRNTPLTSIPLSDALTGLMANQVITPDVNEGAQHAPLRFDPTIDAKFFNDIYWECPLDEQINAAKRLKKRFEHWYKCNARPIDKVYLAVVSLTYTDEAIDTIIDDTKAKLVKEHQVEFIDSDDSIYKIADYHGVRDPVNIVSALNTDQINWWCRQIEEQAHRVLAAPTWDLADFQDWNKCRDDHAKMVRNYFRKNPFAQHGLTVRQGRRTLRRSYRLMEARFGKAQTWEFCKGHPVKIRGHYFDWEIKLVARRDLTVYTVSPPLNHTPYSLHLYNHAGELLGTACVLFEHMPVLDQAVSLSIEVSRPEDELELLREANIWSLSKAGIADPTLNSLSLPNLRRPDPLPPLPDDDETDEALRRFMEQPRSPFFEHVYGHGGWACNVDEGGHDAFAEMDDRARLAILQQRTREDELIDQYVEELGATLRLPERGEGFRGSIISLYGEVLRDHARTMLYRQRDPVAQRIREQLFRRLDVRPDLLEYMALPEFRFQYLERLKCAPRLKGFIEQKLPLGIGDLHAYG